MSGPAPRRAFRGPILENTSNHLLNASQVPVLVLQSAPSFDPLRIVVPFDAGDPARGALDLGLLWAKRAGLLILGTHGYVTIGRALIGSVSSRVVRAATCPDLLVPPSH